MAGSKEIRTKIKSIKNTQKITSAMEMVAASKMRRAQERMRKSRPYADKIREVIGHLAEAYPEYRHPYMIERKVKRIGVIVVSTDRGLCGGLNTNLFKQAVTAMKDWTEAGYELDTCIIGTKAAGFFKRLGNKIVAERSHLGDTPSLDDLIGTVRVMLDAYDNEEIDQLFLVYNRFVNTMTQDPQVQRLLPIEENAEEEQKTKHTHQWDYLYEPTAEDVLDGLLMRYVESLVYQSVVENAACEQAARMIAMKSASDNAGDIIKELQLAYNKSRQAAITQEIAEIVGGAAAV